jgi:hypothetical protein
VRFWGGVRRVARGVPRLGGWLGGGLGRLGRAGRGRARDAQPQEDMEGGIELGVFGGGGASGGHTVRTSHGLFTPFSFGLLV